MVFHKNIGIYVILIGLIVVLSACGNKEEPLLGINVAGKWNDSLVLAQACGQSFFFGLEFTFAQSGNTVNGSGTFIGVNNKNQLVEIPGSFSGKTRGKVLKGIAVYPVADGELTFIVNLTHQAETLIGTFTETTSLNCNDGSQSALVGQTVLITEAVTPVTDDMLEPNNQATQAKTVQAGKTLEGLTLGKGDVDWFKFTLTETTHLVAALELFSEFPVRMRLFNQSANLLATKDISSGLETQVNLFGITPTLQAGSYYLAISAGNDSNYSGNHSENGKYSLELIADTNPENFYEPNEIRETAYAIPNNFTTRVHLNIRDIDYFKFTISKKSLVKIKIQADNGEHLPADLFASYTSQIPDNDENPDSYLYSLKPDEFYLKIDGKYTGGVNYTLTIETSDFPDNLYEPNETRETATPIALDFEQMLFISSDDSDWFQFTIEQPLQAIFDLTLDENLFLDIYQGTELIDSMSANRVKITRVLTQGSYFIRVYGAYSIFNYSLSIRALDLPDADMEPNESFNSATLISLPLKRTLASTTNNIALATDEDWLKFNLSGQQLISISIELDNVGSVQGELYNDQGQVIATLSTQFPNPHDFIFEAGTYYLRLKGGALTGFMYDIDILSEEIPDLKYEPNDTQGDAYPISLGFEDADLLVSWSPTVRNDDFYTFEVPQTMQLTLSITGLVNATLFDAAGQYVQSVVGLTEPILQPGKYIIGVSPSDDVSRYGLSLKIKP